MASLASRLGDLITAIGADIKALQNRVADQHNASSATQGPGFAADTYLSGSQITIPTGKIKVGTKYRCKFNIVKTAAGVATPIFTVRVGTAGTTADGARAVLTMAAQTAVVDEGVVEIECVFRQSGVSAILQALASLGHRLAATGLSTANHSVAVATSATFDVTTANLKIGVSVNGGTSAAWTINSVTAELVNLTP